MCQILKIFLEFDKESMRIIKNQAQLKLSNKIINFLFKKYSMVKLLNKQYKKSNLINIYFKIISFKAKSLIDN